MASNKKKISLKEQKARKQKKIIAVGGVILLAVVAIQAPRMLKLMRGGEQSTAAPYKAFPDGGLAGPTTASPISLATSGRVVLSDSNDAPEASEGQLVDFELFPSKDPFVQQVKPTGEGEADDSGSAKDDKAKSDAEAGDQASGGDGQIEVAPSAAMLSVNGTAERVDVGGKFPANDPAFVLVSASGSSVRIGIAGGSLASGAQTVTLRRGATLTLVNTVDGTEYRLKLLSSS